MCHSVLQCCSVLQRVAVCCSVLQYVAVYCSLLQCVAVMIPITEPALYWAQAGSIAGKGGREYCREWGAGKTERAREHAYTGSRGRTSVYAWVCVFVCVSVRVRVCLCVRTRMCVCACLCFSKSVHMHRQSGRCGTLLKIY